MNEKIETDWATAAATVTKHAELLKTFTEHGQIYHWAHENNLSTADLWPKVKEELRKQLGIDYNELRTQTIGARASAVAHAADGPLIELWAAADHHNAGFAICDWHRDVVWYDGFHTGDWRYADSQVSADFSAAEKAIWLAGKARIAVGAEVARLLLHLSSPTVKHDALLAVAQRARLALTLDVVSEADNPAVSWSRAGGHDRKEDLTSLIHSSEEPAA